ncbi:putative protein family UPF0406 [Niveomyces insectorum RCEF 264]|uniref:U6 snRNA phosphodiesterase n=1 Tax=Niveomyces insectorum RCEF 264 TaxID=1081102 RepID=A0A167N7S1_9HYPO|nr:putative protein family UPF0406 [Niveomyces insectorum RCEF 264]
MMAGLVDYSSEEEEEKEEEEEEAEKPELKGTKTVVPANQRPATAATPAATAALPPLPPAFHDLYAATVRASPVDAPSLHQGRTRAIPHVAGQWPSHLYIEWFPTSAEHTRLTTLLASVRAALGNDKGTTGPDNRRIHSLLASDLGAPLPLHVSLSRPFVLTTSAKDSFRAALVASIAEAHVAPFDLRFSGLCWYRSPDAARAFLVLRVAPTAAPPLIALLRRCNALVAGAGQPALYSGGSGSGSVNDADVAATAFHVSIAWTLAVDTPTWAMATAHAYVAWAHDTDDISNGSSSVNHRDGDGVPCVHVASIKAKIGNVVTDVPLVQARRQC